MAANYFIGTARNDSSSGAFDAMYGDAGDDVLSSSLDVLNNTVAILGGAGDDSLNYVDGFSSFALIFGESGDDTIDGGSNSDDLYGGAGKDLVTGSSDSDYISGDDGNDRLYGYWHAYDDATDGGDNMHGGKGNDRMFGQTGDDDLHGEAGKDILTSGLGEDEFWIDTKLNAKTNVDRIIDFGVGDDIFSLASSVFKELPVGPLAPEAFRFARRAIDADDHIIYDQANGLLSYDPDGKGGEKQVLFANLENHVSLTYLDFYVVPV